MSRKILNGLDLFNKQISNLADGSAATDAVTKQQLDAAIRGLDWKQEVIAASTANATLAAPGTSLDGVALTSGDRVPLKDQLTAAENGIYTWTASGSALSRVLDGDTWAKLAGATTTVQRGTVNADRVYRVTSDDGGTLGTTPITFVQIGGGTTLPTAGAGLTGGGATYDVGAGTGIVVATDSVSIDTNTVARKWSAACVATTNPQTFTHSLASSDITVAVREVSTGVLAIADVTVTDANNISVNFGAGSDSGPIPGSGDRLICASSTRLRPGLGLPQQATNLGFVGWNFSRCCSPRVRPWF